MSELFAWAQLVILKFVASDTFYKNLGFTKCCKLNQLTCCHDKTSQDGVCLRVSTTATRQTKPPVYTP